MIRFVVVAVIVVVAAIAGVQWFRPVPSPAYQPTLSAFVRMPGRPPALPWPTTGEAALTVSGIGSFGSVGSTRPQPIASIAKVMTAYVVLHDHPLASGASGPTIPITSQDVLDYQLSVLTQQSAVAVASGEALVDLQALEGLLVPSGNNLARLLATWDAGSISAFVAKMNAAALSLGLKSTHFAGPSGLNQGSTSTPTDLIRLGEAAMAVPTFAHIVAMPQVTLPVAGLLYNYNYALGHDGIIGIKTGTDGPAGGCFLFEAQPTVAGHKVAIIGAVLGQRTVSPITAVLDTSEALVKTAAASLTSGPLLTRGSGVGHVVTSWNASSNVVTAGSIDMVGWPGLEVEVTQHAVLPHGPVRAGERIGSLSVTTGGHVESVAVRAASSVPGPSASWKLSRL